MHAVSSGSRNTRNVIHHIKLESTVQDTEQCRGQGICNYSGHVGSHNGGGDSYFHTILAASPHALEKPVKHIVVKGSRSLFLNPEKFLHLEARCRRYMRQCRLRDKSLSLQSNQTVSTIPLSFTLCIVHVLYASDARAAKGSFHMTSQLMDTRRSKAHFEELLVEDFQFLQQCRLAVLHDRDVAHHILQPCRHLCQLGTCTTAPQA